MPTNTPLSDHIIVAVLLTVGAIYGAMALMIAVIGACAFWRTPEGAPRSFRMLFIMAAPVVTVAFVILAAVILSVTDRFSQGVATLLGGVAGYVLGSFKQAWSYDDKPMKKRITN